MLEQSDRLKLIQGITVGVQACVLSLLPILLFRGCGPCAAALSLPLAGIATARPPHDLSPRSDSLTTIFRHRDLLFLVFLGVPKRVLKKMAERRSEAQEDSDGSDSDASLDSSDEEPTEEVAAKRGPLATRADSMTSAEGAGAANTLQGTTSEASGGFGGVALPRLASRLPPLNHDQSFHMPTESAPTPAMASTPAMPKVAAESKGAHVTRVEPDAAGTTIGAVTETKAESKSEAKPMQEQHDDKSSAAGLAGEPKHPSAETPDKKGKRDRNDWMTEQRVKSAARQGRRSKHCTFAHTILCYLCLRRKRRVHPADHHVMVRPPPHSLLLPSSPCSASSPQRQAKIVYLLYAAFLFVVIVLGGMEVARNVMANISSRPLRDVHATASMLYLASRLRLDAASLVDTPYSDAQAAALRLAASPVTAMGRETLRRRLREDAERLKLVHSAVLYGGSPLALDGSVDRSPAQQSLYFGSGCLRLNTTSCFAVRVRPLPPPRPG